ncbi:MAG: hypothetical protein KDA93_13900 [Planctomycetaceae bacterium]|nr:hypothetical protein [Planctomycetaceae bacterium]
MRHFPWKTFLAIQAVVLAAFGVAYAVSTPVAQDLVEQELLGREPFVPVAIPRSEPLVVEPLYDRPDLVSDEELAAVLDRVLPRFHHKRTKPNFVEHAVRIWGVNAEFDDPQAMSGQDMQGFLTDHARYAASWGDETESLVVDRPEGLAIRWGRETGASVHHDHWLASLTEGGVTIDTPVYGPARRGMVIGDVIQESLSDFRLDERETEWTAMAFGLWLPPTREWVGSGGRQYSFDLLVRRLMRGQKELGVCSGTHRVYSLMLLIRLDDEFDILSDGVRATAYSHLENVRDRIIAAQWDDGRWPSNWPNGADAAANHIDEELYKQVIATGHHLEWLAIAPPELHPPDEQIRKAARWVIDTTTSQTANDILPRYTFYSHVGNALALWRKTHPTLFWRTWRASHPYAATPKNTVDWETESTDEDDTSSSH